MDLNFTREEIAFREEVREVFQYRVQADIRRKCILRPAPAAQGGHRSLDPHSA